MPNAKNDYANRIKMMPTPQGAEVIAVRLPITVPASMLSTEALGLGFLPAGCLPVDCALDYDDLDTGATGAVSFGLLNAGMTALDGTGWIVAQSVQSAGYTRRSTNTLDRVTVSETDRPVGVVFTGNASGAGALAATLMYRSAQYKQ